MIDGLKTIDNKLTAFKKKYYLNLFVKGTLLSGSLLLLYYLLAVITEHALWLNGITRFIIFILFFCFVVVCLFKFLQRPLLWLFQKKGLSEEEVARMIGQHFPEVSDRLLNVLQLTQLGQKSALASAGIFQKVKLFENIAFEKAVDLKSNQRYLNYFLIPAALMLILFFYDKNILTQSTSRIVNFNQEFSPKAPFTFDIQNKNLLAFINEDFTLRVKLQGESIPEALFLDVDSRSIKLLKDGTGTFAYTFEKIQSDISFSLEAAGFQSAQQTIKVINRPELTHLKIVIQYPPYLKRKSVEIINSGDFEIPEGSSVNWRLSTLYTSKAFIHFSSNQQLNSMHSADNQLFEFNKGFNDSDQYIIDLENENSQNKEKISHLITVVKDQYPAIRVNSIRDTVLFKKIYLSGEIKDDYGLTNLSLFYQLNNGNKANTKRAEITFNPNAAQSSFYYSWNLDSIDLKPGDKLTYFLEVWDNDGVNGKKSTKSQVYTFSLPSADELKDQISKDQTLTESKIDESIQKASELKKSLEEAQQKLKGKQSMDWQDKKKLEEIAHQKEALDKAINELQKQNKALEEKKEEFSKENESIKQKSDQIQKLLNELMDEETKKLFEQLQKLVKENAEPSQLQKMLDKINRKEIDLEKELERTLELFKELQFDYKMDQAIKELEQQIAEQESIQKKTDELSKEKNETGGSDKANSKQDSLAAAQEKLNDKLNDFQKTVDELEKLGDELEKPTDSPSKEEMDQIDKNQKESKNELSKKQPKKASDAQKKALDKMKQVKSKLENSQSGMEMEIDMQNLESLRQAVHGLVKLSFDQEQIMKDFAGVQQIDPKYLTLSQNQIKIKDDAKVLEDSLLAISKRDAFMSNIVIKEIGELNDHFAKATENIKERKKQNAATEMQLSMTSINNLALMLDDHYSAMMEMMAKAKSGKGKGKKKSGKEPSLSQMQQKINDKINQLKKGGAGDKAYSEEFARMAAEQERIRRALQEMENKLRQQGGKMPGGNLAEEMEKTEMELVNKQLTDQTIKRQQEIMTRLLETEKSMREQNQDEERKGESAKDYEKEIPRAFEKYLELKQKEAELLKTIPPKLFPYYKKEVDNYFKRIETDKINE